MSKCFVAFTRSTTFFGGLIRMFQGGKYNHVAIAIFMDSYSAWYAIDSTRSGVKIHRISNFSKHNKLVLKYDIASTEAQRKKILEMAVQKSYQKYPIIEVVGNALQLIFRLKKNPFSKGNKAPRCNELVALVLKEVFGQNIKEDLDSIDLVWLDTYIKEHLNELSIIKN